MSSYFDISETPIADLVLLRRKLLGDSRGYLERFFCQGDLKGLLKGRSIVQMNHTLTVARGTVRGLHYQMPPHAEIKFVSCIRGEVFDVAVDLRRESSTFLMWHAEILSADNHRTIVIPEGFAHGFQALSDECEMVYLHTEAYQPSAERGLSAVDPKLSIQWPLPVSNQSPRDLAHSLIDGTFEGVAL